VICAKDVADDSASAVPWYQPLDPDAAGSWSSMTSATGFRLTRLGRLLTRAMVKAMERLGVAPEGSVRVSGLMETAGEGLVKGGRAGIFTPMFFVLARKKPVAN
jgi:sterol 24-C-methyltransferase